MSVIEDKPVVRDSEMPMCISDGRRPRMLVPIDCSEFSEAIIETAACTAQMLKADVYLLAVLPETDHATARPSPAWYPSYSGEGWPGSGQPASAMVETRDQALDAERQEAADHLRQAAKQFAGLPITPRVLSHKSIAAAIVDYARDCKIDLIVMPTHGRRPLAQTLLGSVASEVVHSGVAPCLLVKPKEA